MADARLLANHEGDGYSEQWKQEAARRGLTNICHVPEALMHYMDNQSLFRYDIENPEQMLRVDRSQIEQVLINLLKNAQEAVENDVQQSSDLSLIHI